MEKKFIERCETCLQEAIERFRKEVDSKKIIFWGQGNKADQTLRLLNGIVPAYSVGDYDQGLQALKNEKPEDIAIVIAIDGDDFLLVKKKIENMFSTGRADIYISFADWAIAIQQNIRRIEALYDQLEDDYSRSTMEAIVCSRLKRFLISPFIFYKMSALGDCLLKDIDCNYRACPLIFFQIKVKVLEPFANQYFRTGIFDFSDQEVYIDAGAYTGDTIAEFISVVKDQYAKIYAFEPDSCNFEKMKKNIITSTPERIVLENRGVSDQNSQAYFSEEASLGSHFMENGDALIEMRKLDDFIDDKVTFIKMDVEGFEESGLRGAVRILKNDAPKLAICLYHKPTDLWEIPLLVKSINSKYKLYIRHHSPFNFETILYACI